MPFTFVLNNELGTDGEGAEHQASFSTIKRIISGSKLKTAVVVHYGATQWMRLKSVMSKKCPMFTNTVCIILPLSYWTHQRLIHHICVVHSFMFVYLKKYSIYDHSDQLYLSLTICSTTFHLSS